MGVALHYLRNKFPGVDDKVFYTDYAGDVHEKIIDESAILSEIFLSDFCNKCEGSNCLLPESIREKNSRVITKICDDKNGRFKFLDVRRTCGLRCKFSKLSGVFGQLYKNSGLTQNEISKTFETYECGDNKELKIALIEAVTAFKSGRSLILAGKRGTGKTHLAISIAIKSMQSGRSVAFRLVNSMLDELRDAVLNTGKYFKLIDKFKAVDCLILDDFGKEKNTAAGIDYLHQIIDFRYRNFLQTIITTNALSPSELCAQSGIDFVAPVVSRMLERGRWITIKNAPDYRVKN